YVVGCCFCDFVLCFVSLFSFFFFFVYIMYYLLGTRTRVQCQLWRKENLNSKKPVTKKISSLDSEKQSKTPRPSGMGPTAHLPHQTKEKTWGESNEKTLSVHTAKGL